MQCFTVFGSAPPDIGLLQKSGDVPALIRLLDHASPDVQWRAAEALGRSGDAAVLPLLSALRSRSVPVRLGATEALGTIRDIRAVPPLVSLLERERVPEVRWGAVLALGAIGSADAIPAVVLLLGDRSRYVRYGAATTLLHIGWQPESGTDRARLSFALQDWEALKRAGRDAALPLAGMLDDDDPATRATMVSLLRWTGDRTLHDACRTALKDRDPKVRWQAVLSSMDCGVAPRDLPLMVASRERTGPNPAAAALLNFLFLGIGYNYLGKWWGFPVFMAYMSVLVLAQLAFGPFIPYAAAYPVTAVIGVHTYYLAEQMADRR